MKKNKAITNMIILTLLIFGFHSFAIETQSEKVDTTVNKIEDNVKSDVRTVKDKGCEMVNGKMKCLGKKMKRKAKTINDKVQTKAKEIKNKID